MADELLPGPYRDKDFSDVGLLADGGLSAATFAHVYTNGAYMMDIDGARTKADGQAEEEAVGHFKPIWQKLRFDDLELTTTQSLQSFKGLLQRAQITAKKNTAKEKTHIAMDGGKFHIPFESSDKSYPLDTESTFLKLYAHAYLQGQKMWFIEARTPVFRLFVDLDFKQVRTVADFFTSNS